MIQWPPHPKSHLNLSPTTRGTIHRPNSVSRSGLPAAIQTSTRYSNAVDAGEQTQFQRRRRRTEARGGRWTPSEYCSRSACGHLGPCALAADTLNAWSNLCTLKALSSRPALMLVLAASIDHIVVGTATGTSSCALSASNTSGLLGLPASVASIDHSVVGDGLRHNFARRSEHFLASSGCLPLPLAQITTW